MRQRLMPVHLSAAGRDALAANRELIQQCCLRRDNPASSALSRAPALTCHCQLGPAGDCSSSRPSDPCSTQLQVRRRCNEQLPACWSFDQAHADRCSKPVVAPSPSDRHYVYAPDMMQLVHASRSCSACSSDMFCVPGVLLNLLIVARSCTTTSGLCELHARVEHLWQLPAVISRHLSSTMQAARRTSPVQGKMLLHSPA